MIIVREVFIAKPGMASKLAKIMKEQWGEGRVMTDVAGQYNTVVMEHEYQSLSIFEEEMKKYMTEGKNSTNPTGSSHTDLYLEGRREIFRVW